MTTFTLIEGFDVYPNIASTSYGLQARWLAASVTSAYGGLSITGGRFGGQAIKWGGQINNFRGGFLYPLYASGGGVTTMTVGFAFNLQISVFRFPLLTMLNGGTTGTAEWGVGINSAQQLYLWQSAYAVPIATLATPITTGSWHYLELVWTGGMSGSIVGYLDGLEVFNFSGNTGAGSVDTMGFVSDSSQSANPLAIIDDVYVTDTASRIGEMRVETLYPSANGTVSWTPLTGANWQEVSEAQCDGDTSYNFTSTPTDQDLFDIVALENTPTTIPAVQISAAIRKTDATSRVTHTVLLSNVTTVEGADWAVSGSYLYDIDIWTADPDTSMPWTAAGVNAAQIGYKLIS